MKATIPYVEEKFREFNTEFFAGKLPTIPIKLSNAKTFLGVCTYKQRRRLFGASEPYDFCLRINTRIDLPEREVEDIIIHEMIHYHIALHGISDTSAHGPAFRKIMQTINERHGRNVRISHKITKEQSAEAIDKRTHLRVVARVSFADGTTGLKVLPRVVERILNYSRKVSAAPEVSRVELFATRNPFFNRYPCSAVLKAHPIDGEELDRQLEGAQRLVWNGRTFAYGR